MASGYDLTDEKETEDFLRDVEIEYHFQCYDQKEPDGCHRLAEFWENIKRNVPAAVPLYKENCDKSLYPKSCFKYGRFLLNGAGLPDDKKDPDGALQYFEKSCELGHAPGCFVAAQQYMRKEEDVEKNTERAIKHLSRACDLRDGEACFNLSGYYLTGKKVKKDLKKAFEIAKTGCQHGHAGACNNLGLMYKNGHGVDKNQALAEEAQKRAKDLMIQHAAKQRQLKVNQ